MNFLNIKNISASLNPSVLVATQSMTVYSLSCSILALCYSSQFFLLLILDIIVLVFIHVTFRIKCCVLRKERKLLVSLQKHLCAIVFTHFVLCFSAYTLFIYELILFLLLCIIYAECGDQMCIYYI